MNPIFDGDKTILEESVSVPLADSDSTTFKKDTTILDTYKVESDPIENRRHGACLAHLRGLHYAHELKDENGDKKGLLHRDVKPGNLR